MPIIPIPVLRDGDLGGEAFAVNGIDQGSFGGVVTCRPVLRIPVVDVVLAS